jgi:hypothetical protein
VTDDSRKPSKGAFPVDRSYVELNRASTERMRALAARLTDEELQRRVCEHWSVAIALAHLAFWDARALVTLEWTQAGGVLSFPQIDVAVNDILLPHWAAITPRAAAVLAVETAQVLDARLESFPPELLEQIHAYNPRWVVRALHRNDHLDEIDVARSVAPADIQGKLEITNYEFGAGQVLGQMWKKPSADNPGPTSSLSHP